MHRTAIFGPPGTGKTTRLMEIVEKELEAGVPISDIAFVSFTNAAVDEAKQRVKAKFGVKDRDILWFRTIHSLCNALVKVPGQRVVGRKDLVHFQKLYRVAEFSTNPRRKMRGDVALEAHHLARSARISLQDAWTALVDNILYDFGVAQDTVSKYEKWKSDSGLIDFQDIIDNYLKHPVQAEIEVSIIDEVQDLNGQQWEVIETTFAQSARQYVAGDDDQAIYTWAGARVDKMLDYPADETIVLDQSHRCPASVHAVANMIAKRIDNRKEKNWKPRKAKGKFQMYGDYAFVPWDKYVDDTWFALARADYMLEEIRWWLETTGVSYVDERGRSCKIHHARRIMTILELQTGAAVSLDRIKDALWNAKMAYNTRDLLYLKRTEKYTADQVGINLDDADPIDMFKHSFDNKLMAGRDISEENYYRLLLHNEKDLVRKPRIVLSTINKAKGLEADNVVLVTDQSGAMMDSALRNMNDEHRIWYVAVTRAKKRLFPLLGQSLHYYDL